MTGAAKDWHRADVKAALEKTGWSLRRLSVANGYSPGLLKAALYKPYPNAERIIAAIIGMPPQEIWPSRYDANGQPNRPLFGRIKYRPRPRRGNVQKRKVA